MIGPLPVSFSDSLSVACQRRSAKRRPQNGIHARESESLGRNPDSDRRRWQRLARAGGRPRGRHARPAGRQRSTTPALFAWPSPPTVAASVVRDRQAPRPACSPVEPGHVDGADGTEPDHRSLAPADVIVVVVGADRERGREGLAAVGFGSCGEDGAGVADPLLAERRNPGSSPPTRNRQGPGALAGRV